MKNLRVWTTIWILGICAAGMAVENTSEISWCSATPEATNAVGCWGDWDSCTYWAEEEYVQCMDNLWEWAGSICLDEWNSIGGCASSCFQWYPYLYGDPLSHDPYVYNQYSQCVNECAGVFGYTHFQFYCMQHYLGTNYQTCAESKESYFYSCWCNE